MRTLTHEEKTKIIKYCTEQLLIEPFISIISNIRFHTQKCSDIIEKHDGETFILIENFIYTLMLITHE